MALGSHTGFFSAAGGGLAASVSVPLALLFALLAAALIGIGVSGIRKMKKASDALPLASLLSMFKTARESGQADNKTPRSLNGMDSIYRPMIAEDFPDLRLDALGSRAENLLIKSYEALGKRKVSAGFYDQAGRLYAEALERLIVQHRAQGGKAPVFSQVKVHKRVLSMYGRYKGKRSIEFQFAVEAMVSNRDGMPPERRQMRDRMRFHYMEDEKKFAEAGNGKGVLSRSCPNCGAPLKGRNEEQCPYCGTTVKALELEVWLPAELIPEIWLEAAEEKPMNDAFYK